MPLQTTSKKKSTFSLPNFSWPSNTRCQFHQHFTRGFFVQKFWAKLFVLIFKVELFWEQEYWHNFAHKKLVKLTTVAELTTELKDNISDCSAKLTYQRLIELNHVSAADSQRGLSSHLVKKDIGVYSLENISAVVLIYFNFGVNLYCVKKKY